MSAKLLSKEEEKKLIRQILKPNGPKLVPLVKDLEICSIFFIYNINKNVFFIFLLKKKRSVA